MDTTKSEIHRLIFELKSGGVKWYQFYNTENPTINKLFSLRKEYEFSSSHRRLNKTTYDIEVDIISKEFPIPSLAKYPVNSIVDYNNVTNTITMDINPYILMERDITNHPYHEKWSSQRMSEFEQELRPFIDNYIKTNPIYHLTDNIVINMFDDEVELLMSFFKRQLKNNIQVLTGWNNIGFDKPYLYNRLYRLLDKSGEEPSFDNWLPVIEKISRFKSFRKFDGSVEIYDYLEPDMYKLYRPVDQGGNGLGRSQPNYSLQTIVESELKLSKLKYKFPLYQLFRKDPLNFFLYSFLDTVVTTKLDMKLNHIDMLDNLATSDGSFLTNGILGNSSIQRVRKFLNYYNQGFAVRTNLFSSEFNKPSKSLTDKLKEQKEPEVKK
jgi:DNA polymerase elongation subunit (family B)